MNEKITEWEFTADVSSWINLVLAGDHTLPFSEAKCEQRSKGSLKRRDLTIKGKSKQNVLTGEVKLPFSKDGGSPYNENVVQDARQKAIRAKVDYFFTWNINECVLWETFPSKTKFKDRKYQSWEITHISKPEHLEHPYYIDQIKNWLPVFLNDFAKILGGKIQLGQKSPDEKFIESLESALTMPIILTLEEIVKKNQGHRFKNKLDKWMREVQGWVISDDQEIINENLTRASKFSCYALVNKLVFYEAMLKRYGLKLEKILIPLHIEKGESLRLHLERHFARAKEVTGDYETVFGEDHNEFGNYIPFCSDAAVFHWRELIEQIHHFDFSKLDYDIIGNLFVRLISPEERHKYGQYYTRPEIVDLINSFCIRNGDEKVLDPACGGGTFLVRAYARKRHLMPARKHSGLLSDLYGIDTSNFATHLTTINLATRDLIDDENYPQVARSDFFNVIRNKAFLSLPDHIKTKGMGKIQHRNVEIEPLDAIVGNPPYVRQEEIGKKAKNHYIKITKTETPSINLSGRSDLHCYFWPHGTTFLKEGGYFCFLTSSQWLDAEYGFKLQNWILKNFKIVAIIESIDEPWFVGARVVTAVTILKKETEENQRNENVVRFVQLRRPIKEILESDGTTPDQFVVTDEFRDELLNLKKNKVNKRYRVKLVPQEDILNEGLKLGEVMGKPESYYGGKWGIHLRAPDIWFHLIENYGENFSPLGEIADIWWGVKSGKDDFFYPRDISNDLLSKFSDPKEFKETFGLERKLVSNNKVRLVSCGKKRGEIKPIEPKYLEPELHTSMEVNDFTVLPGDCSRKILLVNKNKGELKDPYVKEYIKWGEKQGYHKGSTCEARGSQSRNWYDLTGHKRGNLFWPKSQQYKHIIPENENNLICNCNLFDVSGKEIESDLLGGILNSSIIVLSKLQYGRPVGVEGNLKTEGVDINMMLTPNPVRASKANKKKVVTAFKKLIKRKPLYFLSERRLKEMKLTQAGKKDELDALSNKSELDMGDRYELDEAILEMLGVNSKLERKRILNKLYDFLRDHFEQTRLKEEKAIKNKNLTKRKGLAKPGEIAGQISKEIENSEPHLLRKYDPDFFNSTYPYDVYELPEEGEPSLFSDMFIPKGVIFKNKKKTIKIVEVEVEGQELLLSIVAEEGKRGLVPISRDPKELQNMIKTYRDFLIKRDHRLSELIEERTADEETQAQIYSSLIHLIRVS